MRVNHGLKPPDGPHFPVAPGVVLRAHTFDMLYPMIHDYRITHGIDPGDPRKDVDNYVCAKWPNACLQEAGDGPTENDQKKLMSARVATWAAMRMRDMPAGGYALVGDDVARDRAAACIKCPYNVGWKTGCSPCNAGTESLLSVLRRLRRVSIDSSLLGCQVCGHDTDTAVFMPNSTETPTEDQRPRLPPGCWKKNL